MKSDAEIERLLENHLEETARAMPQHVLENAIEATARTPQVRVRSWLWAAGRRPLAYLVAVAVGVLVLAAGGLFLSRLQQLGNSPSTPPLPSPGLWNPVSDFVHRPDHANPNPDGHGHREVWSFLWSTIPHAPARYELMTVYTDDRWRDPSDTTTVYPDQGAIVLHPGYTPDGPAYVILGWRSPTHGPIAVRGSVTLGDFNCTDLGSGVNLFVDRGAETLLHVRVPSGGSENMSVATTIEEGDSLYFIVDPGRDNLCDSTLLRFRIYSGLQTPGGTP